MSFHQNSSVNESPVVHSAIENHVRTAPEPSQQTPAQIKFYASERCANAREALERLSDNPSYNTASDYFCSSPLSFTDRHLQYISNHPTLNVDGYVSNLRLMTRLKR